MVSGFTNVFCLSERKSKNFNPEPVVRVPINSTVGVIQDDPLSRRIPTHLVVPVSYLYSHTSLQSPITVLDCKQFLKKVSVTQFTKRMQDSRIILVFGYSIKMVTREQKPTSLTHTLPHSERVYRSRLENRDLTFKI